MKDWRKLKKSELIHLIEAVLTSKRADVEVEERLREVRAWQLEMKNKPGSSREVCWDCKLLSKKLGIE